MIAEYCRQYSLGQALLEEIDGGLGMDTEKHVRENTQHARFTPMEDL